MKRVQRHTPFFGRAPPELFFFSAGGGRYMEDLQTATSSTHDLVAQGGGEVFCFLGGNQRRSYVPCGVLLSDF